jgi:hypothetical protein
MGYAGVAGVAWVVLTDGNEYRLYNSHATVPIEEKLFRAVRVTDDPTTAHDTLMLLSKERMRENEIEVLWKAHFVDRQVQAAIRDLFSSTPDPAIVRLVAKKIPSLSPKEVRTSLQRASLSFHFPVTPSADGAAVVTSRNRKRKDKDRGRHGRVTRKFRNLGVQMSEIVPLLVREGVLKVGTEITADYHGRALKATIASDGQVEFRGAKYKSPSAAGAAAKQYVTGKYVATDGWYFWRYFDKDGKQVPLSAARLTYLANRKSVDA